MRIGFVGVGGMGHGMAGRLLDAGHALTVIAHRNRAPVEDLVARGAEEADDLAALARASETVVLCVSNSRAVESVIGEMTPALRPGMTILDMGTSSPASSQALDARLAALGVAFVEAPVAGGVKQAAAGELGALVGARAEDLERVRPLLEAMCRTVQHFGPPGTAGTAKLLSNYLVFGMAALVFETFGRAEGAGIDWRKLYEVAICGSGDSGVLRRIVGNAVAGDFGGYVFTVANTLKDLRYFEDVARETGGASDLSSAVVEVFEKAVAAGHGERRLSELLDPAVREAVAKSED